MAGRAHRLPLVLALSSLVVDLVLLCSRVSRFAYRHLTVQEDRLATFTYHSTPRGQAATRRSNSERSFLSCRPPTRGPSVPSPRCRRTRPLCDHWEGVILEIGLRAISWRKLFSTACTRWTSTLPVRCRLDQSSLLVSLLTLSHPSPRSPTTSYLIESLDDAFRVTMPGRSDDFPLEVPPGSSGAEGIHLYIDDMPWGRFIRLVIQASRLPPPPLLHSRPSECQQRLTDSHGAFPYKGNSHTLRLRP